MILFDTRGESERVAAKVKYAELCDTEWMT